MVRIPSSRFFSMEHTSIERLNAKNSELKLQGNDNQHLGSKLGKVYELRFWSRTSVSALLFLLLLILLLLLVSNGYAMGINIQKRSINARSTKGLGHE